MKKTPVDLQKRFPKNHAYPKYLAADCCGLAVTLDHDEMEITLVDLGTGDGPLRTDSATLKPLESFIQLTSFCNS